jgi:hypothetical protein
VYQAKQDPGLDPLRGAARVARRVRSREYRRTRAGLVPTAESRYEKHEVCVMATLYEAIVRLRAVDIPEDREPGLIALIGQNLPEQARISTDRDSHGRLLVSVMLGVVAADASEVQLEAADVVTVAANRAGLSEQAALLDDISVRASS